METSRERDCGARSTTAVGLLVAALLAVGCGADDSAYRAADAARSPVVGVPTTHELDDDDASVAEARVTATGRRQAEVTDVGPDVERGPGAGAGTGPSASSADPSVPPPAAPSRPTSGAGSTPPSAVLPPAPPQQGLSAEAIKLGFVKLGSWQNLGENFGVVAIDWGDVDAQVAALVDWVNAHGGIDGRRVEYVIEEYRQEDASAEVEAQICNRMVDDEKVWGVVLQGQIHFSTRACYADRGVLVLDPSVFSFDDDVYARHHPLLVSPSTPALSRVVGALATSLDRRGWFEAMPSRGEAETRLGIVHWDDPYARRVLEQDLLPVLARLGRQVALTHAVDNSDAGTIQSGLTNGIVRFQTEGINRVLFVGGNPIAPLWFLNAEQYRYAPRYGLTTFDGPAHTTDQTPNQMRDALGIGFNAVHDVRDAQYPFPSENPTERLCLDVMAEGGQRFAARRGAELGLAYCEALLLLRSGAKGLGAALSAANWTARVERLGSGFRAAVGFEQYFAPGRLDGGRGYRDTEHRGDCGCFHYVGPVQRFA